MPSSDDAIPETSPQKTCTMISKNNLTSKVNLLKRPSLKRFNLRNTVKKEISDYKIWLPSWIDCRIESACYSSSKKIVNGLDLNEAVEVIQKS